jgi:hypothetical protein
VLLNTTHALCNGWSASARELEAAERRHARAMEEARHVAADAQEAWRSALSEKLRREAAERERTFKERLARERDEEVEVSALLGSWRNMSELCVYVCVRERWGPDWSAKMLVRTLPCVRVRAWSHFGGAFAQGAMLH